MTIDTGEFGLLMMANIQHLPFEGEAAFSKGDTAGFLPPVAFDTGRGVSGEGSRGGARLSLEDLFIDLSSRNDQLNFPGTARGGSGRDSGMIGASSDGDPNGDDDGDGIPNSDDPDSVIVVIGRKPLEYDPNPGEDTGGGGGSTGGTASGKYTYTEDDPCADGVAVEAKDKINTLVREVGNFEFVGLIVQNADGSHGIYQDTIHTDYDPDHATFTKPSNASAASGIIHNHTWNTSTSRVDVNFINRYPSGADWAALGELITLGANPANLSVYIIDPWGVVREFKHADKDKFEGMDDRQRAAGENLPPETSPCGPVT